jgi:hypothetical protein
MIAEITAPVEIASWLACAAFAVVLTNGLFKLVNNVKGPNALPPAGELDLRVSNLETRTNTIEVGLAELRHEMKEDLKTMLAAGEERAGKIHGRINDVLAAVSELRGRLK